MRQSTLFAVIYPYWHPTDDWNHCKIKYAVRRFST